MGVLSICLRLIMQITTNPAVNTVEDWQFVNLTPDSHPIHIHEAFFQVCMGMGHGASVL